MSVKKTSMYTVRCALRGLTRTVFKFRKRTSHKETSRCSRAVTMQKNYYELAELLLCSFNVSFFDILVAVVNVVV